MDAIKRNRAADLDLSDSTKRFLRELFGESIGSPSAATKLDAIIEMLRAQSGVAADLALVKEQLNTIHGLLAGLESADPDKIKELAASVKSVREKLQTSIDNQPKGD